ncbi:MAG: diacylglycerol kinase family protein [Anaerolineae bacterium]
MTHRALVVFNPQAGRGRGHKRAEEVQQALQAADIHCESVVSENRGHAIELAQRAALAGWELIVAAGGDGTINEVVNGLMLAEAEGATSRLGVMPIGSGNDFAGSLGIPLDLGQAAQRLARGQVRRIDLGRVNGRYFDNNVGLAFEAMIGIEAHRITWLRGQPQYLIAVFRALASYPLPVVDIYKDDGDRLAKQILLISVGNNRRNGGGFLVNPDAVPDDGLLDVCIADAIPRLQILRLLPKAMKGTHRGEPVVELTRSTRLVVESATPLPLHADGEILENDALRVEITVEPGRLDVMV